MRILCIIDELGSGGAQRQLVGLAIAFQEKGHDVSFLTYHQGDFFKVSLESHRIPISLIQEPRYLSRLLKMRRFIRKGGYDAVISFLEAASFIAEIAGLPWRKWRLIVGERSANPAILKSSKLKFYRWCHFFADYVVANSNENLKIVRKANPFLSQAKCKVVYNLLDSEIWKPGDNYIPKADGNINLLVASNHQFLKNAAGLIEAVNRLKENEKKMLKVAWYGDVSIDNSYEKALRLVNQYSLEEVFSFYPATNEICLKMQQADIVGLFSFYEGLPNVICEAMMVGKPVISSAVSDIKELLKDSPKFIFDPRSVDEIARTLRYVITLSREDLLNIGQHNRTKAMSLFSRQEVVTDYLSLLK